MSRKINFFTERFKKFKENKALILENGRSVTYKNIITNSLKISRNLDTHKRLVFLLGQNFDLTILIVIKKVVIVLFILAEILAQFFLLKTIKSNLFLYKPYILEKILKIKLILIYLIIFTSFIVILILSTRDLTKEFDYILEWNYFVALLFFYFLSFLLWKKN